MSGRLDQARVAASFDRSESYSDNAGVQRIVAGELAQRIAGLSLGPQSRLIEIGCGTGFLTAELIAKGVGGMWLITDKAPGMVERCRQAIGERAEMRFMALDGEYGAAEAGSGFDLICSSMAFQWFDDLPQAVARLLGLLAPGGRLAFTTLTSGTFAEWRAAHRACGLSHGGLAYPDATALTDYLGREGTVEARLTTHVEAHRNALQFLQRLKAIGAGTACRTHRPLSPGELKQVMQRFDAQGARASYEVLTVVMQRPE